MTTLLGTNDEVVATDRTHDWVECGEWIRELRPHLSDERDRPKSTGQAAKELESADPKIKRGIGPESGRIRLWIMKPSRTSNA